MLAASAGVEPALSPLSARAACRDAPRGVPGALGPRAFRVLEGAPGPRSAARGYWQSSAPRAAATAGAAACLACFGVRRDRLVHQTRRRRGRLARRARGGEEAPRITLQDREMVKKGFVNLDDRAFSDPSMPPESLEEGLPEEKDLWEIALEPKADQPKAIRELVAELRDGGCVTLNGATGTGKSLAIAAAIAQLRKPALWLAPTKLLTVQLESYLKEYLPNVVVDKFISPFHWYIPDMVVEEGLKQRRLKPARGATDKKRFEERDSVVRALKRGMKNLIVVASSSALYQDISITNPFPTAALRKQACNLIMKAYYDWVEKGIKEACEESEDAGKVSFEKQRENLLSTVRSDIVSIKKTGKCGCCMEKYAGVLEEMPGFIKSVTIIDRFCEAYGDDWVLVLDESHLVLPSLDRPFSAFEKRQAELFEYGFRGWKSPRPPFSRKELERKQPKHVVYSSATPRQEELDNTQVIDMVNRPTYILDPVIDVEYFPDLDYCSDEKFMTRNAYLSILWNLRQTIAKNEQAVVMCATKIHADVVTMKLRADGIRCSSIHDQKKTDERNAIMQRLKDRKIDGLVGVALLREGIDLPSVSLVIILNADAWGFLRSAGALTQYCGRAARHKQGRVIMYAAKESGEMKLCRERAKLRREEQMRHNAVNQLEPTDFKKPARGLTVYEEETEKRPKKAVEKRKRRRIRRALEAKKAVRGKRTWSLTKAKWLNGLPSDDHLEWERKATLEQAREQLALVGYKDEFVGVELISRVLAIDLLKQYGTLEKILEQSRKNPTYMMRRIRGLGPIRLQLLQNADTNLIAEQFRKMDMVRNLGPKGQGPQRPVAQRESAPWSSQVAWILKQEQDFRGVGRRSLLSQLDFWEGFTTYRLEDQKLQAEELGGDSADSNAWVKDRFIPLEQEPIRANVQDSGERETQEASDEDKEEQEKQDAIAKEKQDASVKAAMRWRRSWQIIKEHKLAKWREAKRQRARP